MSQSRVNGLHSYELPNGRPRKRRKLSIPVPETSPAAPKTSLCERCQSLDFQELFNIRKLTRDGKAIMPLDDLPKDLDATNCYVCKLFASIRNPDTRFKKHHLRVFDSIRILGLKRSGRIDSNNLLAVVPGPVSRKFHKVTNRSLIHKGLIAQLNQRSEQGSVLYGTRLVQPARVLYVELSRWLNECIDVHEECHRKVSEPIPYMKVIDCTELRVVPMQPSYAYFTLSYVWGTVQTTTQSHSDASKNELLASGKIPETIADAIKVVQKLGYRYLWVDQFCIGEADKKSQIDKMDEIYEGSIATIVAAAGDDANSGLPGVSCKRTVGQKATAVKGISMATTLPHISYYLQHSKWRTRAWTYQEAMLSRRIFFFTEAQVYFVCRSTTYCEAIQQSAGPSQIQAKAHDSMALGPSMFRSDSATESRSQRAEFFSQFQEYSHRNLTHEKDALDAFKGLLARSEFQSYWGVPLYFTSSKDSTAEDQPPEKHKVPQKMNDRIRRNSEETIGFARGLLWICPAYTRNEGWTPGQALQMSEYQREITYPSWSWTSLRHHARYLGSQSGLHRTPSEDLPSPPHSTEITIERTDGNTCMFQDLLDADAAKTAHIIPEQTRWIHITGQHIQITLEQKTNSSGNGNPSSHTAIQVDSPAIDGLSKRIGSAWIDSNFMFDADGEPDPRLVRHTWTVVELYRENFVKNGNGKDTGGQSFATEEESGRTVFESEAKSWWMILDEWEGEWRRIGLVRSWGALGDGWERGTFRIG